MKAGIFKRVVLTAAILAASGCYAGVYSDDLGRCLVSSTTPRDRVDLVRWIFGNAAQNPNVSDIATMSAEKRAAVNRATGELFQRLLTQSCRKQNEEAVKHEGALAFQESFQLLGKVAMQELMADPSVRKSFGDFLKYMDEGKLREPGLSKAH